MNTESLIATLYKDHAARILAVLVRIFGPNRFELAEDVLQDAFRKALVHWEKEVPSNPAGWIVQTAKNQAIDSIRSQSKRVELTALASRTMAEEGSLEARVEEAFAEDQIKDDQLRMIFMCCHEDIKPENRIPLILKTLCGLTIQAISRALVIPEATVKKRLYRTRESLRHHAFEFPETQNIPAAMDTVHTVLYLLFNEGFHCSDAKQALKLTFCRDAMGLVKLLVEEPRIANQDTLGLFALMHFQMGRVAARVDSHGHNIPMNLQDRQLWDRDQFEQAIALLGLVPSAPPGASGRFLFEALIAREHCLAEDFSQTNWQAIVVLYEQLVTITQSPVAELNQAIALGYSGMLPEAIQKVTQLSQHRLLKKSHMPQAILAHFYAMSGDKEQAYLHAKLAETLGGTPHEHHAMMQQLERLLHDSQVTIPKT